MLLDSGIDINSKYDGMTLLGLLATRNNYKKTISAIKSLLDRGADIYLEDTVLIICNSECPMEIFELFMSYNPDIYKYMINGNRNLLTACADVGNLEKLQMLNADYKFIDKYGNSLIHYAVYNNNSTDSLKKVKKHGVDIFIKNKKEKTAYTLAETNFLSNNVLEELKHS